MRLLIKHGRVVDPANNVDEIVDVLVEGQAIAEVAKNIKSKADTTIDAADRIVIPGLVDMHVHLREPGREDKETIESGTQAALHGGVTSVLAMPNTTPAIDSIETLRLVKETIDRKAVANVFICAAITKARLGKELTDIACLAKGGAVAISDDGASVDDERLLRQAFIEASHSGILVASHCEDKVISGSGVVNRGIIATRLGLRGVASEAEFKRVERDIRIAEMLGVALHIQHVSCKESVEIIGVAKQRGVRVTAETCPHYLFLTERAVVDYDTNFKMNPPLRSEVDRLALWQGLRDKTIDAVASDHAPHTENEKDIEFDRAESGVVGVQTMLSVVITELIAQDMLDWSQIVEKLSLNPARILKIDRGTLGEGKVADIVIVDPGALWLVSKESLVSKSKNSPFLNKALKGVVTHTIRSGSIAYAR